MIVVRQCEDYLKVRHSGQEKLVGLVHPVGSSGTALRTVPVGTGAVNIDLRAAPAATVEMSF